MNEHGNAVYSAGHEIEPETLPEVPLISPSEQLEISRLEFEITSLRRYLGQLQIKYFNLTGEDI